MGELTHVRSYRLFSFAGALLCVACAASRPPLTAQSQAPEYSGKWLNEPVADAKPVDGPYERARVEGDELVLRGSPATERRIGWKAAPGVVELGRRLDTWLTFEGGFEVALSGRAEARAHVVGGVLCVEVHDPEARTARLHFRAVPASITAEPGNAELAGLAKGLVD